MKLSRFSSDVQKISHFARFPPATNSECPIHINSMNRGGAAAAAVKATTEKQSSFVMAEKVEEGSQFHQGVHGAAAAAAAKANCVLESEMKIRKIKLY